LVVPDARVYRVLHAPECSGRRAGVLASVVNILLVSDYWPVARNPISGIFVKYEAQEYVRQGHEVDVIAPVPWGRVKWRRAKSEYHDGVRLWSPRSLVWPGLQRLPRLVRGLLF